jgi:predicted ATPase
MRTLAAQFLALAEKQEATAPLLHGYRIMGLSLLLTGDSAEGRAHLDRALALYDPAEHRSLAMHFGQDARVSALAYRSLALCILGYPKAALAETERALSDAREIGQAATLMFALALTGLTHICCSNYAAANALVDDIVVLANEKGASLWQAGGMALRGCILTLTGKSSDAVELITSGITAWRLTGATVWLPFYLSHLARAHAELGQFDDAWRCIGEATTAVESTKERWYEADVIRMSGEIALMSPQQDAAKAQTYFERALAIALAQHAKAWELRAGISMARLWRDQGKRDEARDLLAPIYGWFTEGFDTIDLKQAKALLDELAP